MFLKKKNSFQKVVYLCKSFNSEIVFQRSSLYFQLLTEHLILNYLISTLYDSLSLLFFQNNYKPLLLTLVSNLARVIKRRNSSQPDTTAVTGVLVFFMTSMAAWRLLSNSCTVAAETFFLV